MVKASVRIDQLIRRTSGPEVVATVVVDQVYAEIQHEALEFAHPRGGQAKYLEEPLISGMPGRMRDVAAGLLDEDETAVGLWASAGRSVKDAVRENAPREFGDLGNSAALTVEEGGAQRVYEPPIQRRLTEQELDAKDFLRDMGVGYR